MKCLITTMANKRRVFTFLCVVVVGIFFLTIDRFLLESVSIFLSKDDSGFLEARRDTEEDIKHWYLSQIFKDNSPLLNTQKDIEVSSYRSAQHSNTSASISNSSTAAWLQESSIKVTSVQCSQIIKEDFHQMNKSLRIMQEQPHTNVVPFFGILKITRDCAVFKRRREYVTEAGSAEEAEFPIAYSMLVYKDFPQVERLLRAIYRPQNFYCIHYDSKSPELFKDQINELVNCFDNVRVASKTIAVKWGYFAVLEADLICMKDLLKQKTWKYFINLTGQEFPLKTNWQIVKIVKMYQGANDVSASLIARDDKRLTKKEPPPHNITVLKGPVHVTASRAFVEFVINNEKAKDLLEWVHGTQVPDETYFPTLQNTPHLGAPGAFGGGLELMEKRVSMVRFKLWYYNPTKCHGKRIRLVCVFSVGDLPNLTKAKELFANKFLYSYGRHAYDCLEEWHRNRTRDEYLGRYTFDASEYSKLPFVKYRTNLN